MKEFLFSVKSIFWRFNVWLIALLALLVRLLGLKWMSYANFPEFYRDYGMVSRIVLGHAVWLGPPSMLGGFHFPAIYYYSMAPMLWLLHGHPLGLILTGVLFSVLTVVVLFKILYLWTSERGLACIGALLCALSEYSLHLASYTSNPNFLPLFVLWYLYELTLVLQQKATFWNFLWLGVAFAFATQLHTTAALVLPVVTIVALLIFRVRLTLSKVFVAVVAVFVMYIPYLLYETTHGFTNTLRLFSLGANNLHGGNAWFGVLALWNFFVGTITPFNAWYSYTNLDPNSLYFIVAGVITLVILRLIYAFTFGQASFTRSQVRLFSKEARVLLWLWFLVEALVMILYSRAAHDHYLIVLWPLPIILLTWFIWRIKQMFGIYTSVVLAFVVIFSLQIFSFYRHASTSWSAFLPEYKQHYENNPNLEEIGSRWQ